MNLSPTSRTLFLAQIGTFFSGIIVIVCCCLYLSAYPKSPHPGSVSAITCATLAFAFISTFITFFLIIRQKSGRSINAIIEGCWIGLAIIVWVLAAVGGIAKPANDMAQNISCKVLPNGKDTDDTNYIRACQSAFASTAFCIVSALFFIATAVILIIFSFQRAARDRMAAKVQVGGHYPLGPSPSMYRRAEAAGENPTGEPKEEGTMSPSTDPAVAVAPGTSVLAPASTTGAWGNFSNTVYQDPVITQPAAAATPAMASASPYSNAYPSNNVPQASYASSPYDNSIYGQHSQQPSAMSNLSTGYDHQQHPNIYTQPGYPPQQQQPYSGMGTLNTNSPYGNQYNNGQTTPVMSMPRPEHF
ncbi:hypothetical protein BGZ98_005679 [Dissophora globulifera]|nr:hypothetical protein BGZ98_005679 [Dissophora globulifera]